MLSTTLPPSRHCSTPVSGSLGGASPKASVRDGHRLFIAKFPHHSDEWNMMAAWEMTALDLAERCGIQPHRVASSISPAGTCCWPNDSTAPTAPVSPTYQR